LIYLQTEGGVDYAFDCIGSQSVIESAVNSLCPSGTFVAVGLLQPQHTLQLPLMKLLDGLTLTGALYGNFKGKDGVTALTQLYMSDKQFRDSVNLFVSRRISLDQINEAFDALKNGENVIRSVIIYQ
jgi:S-(hydroxymethyl)glutathione dehydrogenase/alcohol dehydrogenase